MIPFTAPNSLDAWEVISNWFGVKYSVYKNELKENIAAPVKKGTVVGKMIYTLDGAEIGVSDVVTTEEIGKIGYFGLLLRMVAGIILK